MSPCTCWLGQLRDACLCVHVCVCTGRPSSAVPAAAPLPAACAVLTKQAGLPSAGPTCLAAPATLGGVAPIPALKVFCTFLCVLSLLVLCAAMAVQGASPASPQPAVQLLVVVPSRRLPNPASPGMHHLPSRVLCQQTAAGTTHLHTPACPAACAGRLPTVHWLPDPAFFGDGALERAKNALGIVPVVMTA